MKLLRRLLFGEPAKGEPLPKKPKFTTSMPVDISYRKWYRGEWIHHIKIGNL